MKLRKLAAMGVAVLTISTLIIGCGGSQGSKDTSSNSEKTEAESAQVGSEGQLKENVSEAGIDLSGKTITIAALAGEPSLGIKTQIPGFEEKYGAHVELVEIPSDQFSEKLLIDLSSGSGIYDCVMGQPDGWDVNPSTHFIPLDDFMNDPAIAGDNLDLDNYFEANLEYFKQDGMTYGLPWKPDLEMYYYRKDLFEDPKEKEAFQEKYGYELAPAKTYEQYMDIGEFFYRPEDNLYGSAIMGTSAGDQFVNLYLARMFSTNTGKLFEEDYSKSLFDTEDCIMVLKSIQKEAEFAVPGFETMTYEQNSSAFIEGIAAQTITWPALWNDSTIKTTSEYGQSKVVGKVGIATLPGWNNSSTPGKSMMGGWWITIPKDSKQPAEAYKLIEYLTSEEAMEPKIAEGSYPVTKSTWEEMKKDEENKAFYDTYSAQLAYQQRRPLITEWGDFKNIIYDNINMVLTGMATPEDAARNMQEKCDALLKEYGYAD